MIKKTMTIFLSFWVLATTFFWIFEGKDLQYDVYAGDTYHHSEDFSASGRIVISAGIGLLASVVVVSLPCAIAAMRKRNRPKDKGSSK